jgi:hypothetical protein
MRWTFVEDVCFLLLDEDGKPIAQMWLHATFINSNRMLCPSGWWDMEKNKKGKKLLKEYAVHLVFHDDGSWSEGASPAATQRHRNAAPPRALPRLPNSRRLCSRTRARGCGCLSLLSPG